MVCFHPLAAECSGKRRRLTYISQEQPQEGDEDKSAEQKKSKRHNVWENVDLILTLQNKELQVERKIKAAFDFASYEVNASDVKLRPVSLSRALCYVFDWVQSLLISSGQNRKGSHPSDPCLDYRCWDILKFCLEKSSPGVSPNLLRAVAVVLNQAVFLLDVDSSFDGEESVLLFENVLRFLSSLLSSNSRAFYNVGVDLWISCAAGVLNLVSRVSSGEGPSSSLSKVHLDLSALLLEQFASFLRFHPNPKNIFRVFVDRLLEPLFEVLVLLQVRAKNREHLGGMLSLVEDVLSNGLFHPSHICGFLSSRNSVVNLLGGTRGANESYHRHLFRKLEVLLGEKKVAVFGGFACLFRLFVSKSKGQQGAYLSVRYQALKKRNEACEGKVPLFESFVQFMEPLLHECKCRAENELSELTGASEDGLIELHCVLRSVNQTLETCIQEKIYVRNEDTAEGNHLRFLKEIFVLVDSILYRMISFWLSALQTSHEATKILPSIAGEIVMAVVYLFEIEYAVVGDNLVNIWLMLFSCLAANISIMGVKPSSLLVNVVCNLGCNLIKVYTELRQVNIPLFALCKAVRFLVNSSNTTGVYNLSPSTYLSSQSCLKAAKAFLGSPELRSTIVNAVKSVPEGQVGSFIQLLNTDIADALEWMRQISLPLAKIKNEDNCADVCMQEIDVRSEMLGRILCEIYGIVLDSLTITLTNSIIVGNSVKNLVKILSPSLGYFLQRQPNNISDFVFAVTGFKISDAEKIELGNSSCVQVQSVCWIFLFFFRLYFSSRNLCRRSIILMPPDLSFKASYSLGDLFVSATSMDWVEQPEFIDQGYFSWIEKPLMPLPEVIKILSSQFLSRSFSAHAPLVCILHLMALRRIEDLSRLIAPFEFCCNVVPQVKKKQLNYDAAGKRSKKKLKRLIAGFKNEAAELTNFIMGHLSLLDAKKSYAHFDDTGEVSGPHDGEWNFCFCSLEEKSLHVVIWWLFCHYADIWCAYSSKKHLKRFLRLLFLFTLPCPRNNTAAKGGKVQESFCQAAILRRICLAFLQGATPQKQLMLSKGFSSSFCSFLKNCLSPILSLASANDLDLNSSPNWVEVLNMLNKGHFVFFNSEEFAMHDGSLLSMSENGLPNLSHAEHCGIQSLSSFTFELKACESLLNLFCEIPIHYGREKSFTLFSTYILNIERLLLSNILNHYGNPFISDRCELLRLFILCRKAIRHLVLASFAKGSGVKGLIPISTVFYCPYSVLWLFKSVYKLAELPHAFFGDGRAIQVQKMMSYLLDHTSLVFQKISEATVSSTLLRLVNSISIKEQILRDDFVRNSKLPESEGSPRPFTSCEDWEYVDMIAEDLKKHVAMLLVTLKDIVQCMKSDDHTNRLEWSKISCVISCFHGLMLGIAAAYGSISSKETMENQPISSLVRNCLFRLSDLVNIFLDFSILCLKMLFVNHGVVDTVVNLMGDSEVLDIMEGTVMRFAPIDGSNSNQGNKRSGISTFLKQRLPSSYKKWAIDFLQMLNKVDLLKFKNCLGYLIPDLLEGTSPQIAFIHRQLIVTSAALLKLKRIAVSDVLFNHQSHDSLSVFIVNVFATSNILMQEFSEMIGDPCWFCFAQLNGILEFFDVLGSICSFSDPDIANDFYNRLIELHLKALGKCITLKGRVYSCYTETTRLLSLDHEECSIDAFKTKLRMSFKKYISMPSMAYVNMAIQVIKKSLVGISQDYGAVYELSADIMRGGRVSPAAAASIDCLELILESFSGYKQVLKQSMPTLIGAIVNIVLHLQSPSIFYSFCPDRSKIDPDAGVVVLMCIEIFSKVVGRRMFRLDPFHVSQCFHIPMLLFEGFYKLRVSPVGWNSSIFSGNKEMSPSSERHLCIIDHQFSVELYTSCCRLMCTTLKHHQGEAVNCISLLEESVSALLCCLELVDSHVTKRDGYFSWELGEAIKCASFLRRIYEEIRHQKDTLGGYASFFLSNYVSIFSGYGPCKVGIAREVDEALRPGVYSLIDICTHADLQQLHTVLDEGPSRSTLASLLHDYQRDFKYEGKV